MRLRIGMTVGAKMLEIAGGILLAVAVLVVLVAGFRYIVLALSAAFCLAIIAGAWLLLSSAVGQWWATVAVVVGLAGLAAPGWFEEFSYWRANHASTIGGLTGAKSAESGQDSSRKSS